MKEWKVIIILAVAISIDSRVRGYWGIGNWLEIIKTESIHMLLIEGVALLLFGRRVIELNIFFTVVAFANFFVDLAFFMIGVPIYALTGLELPNEIHILMKTAVAVKLFRKRKMFANFFVGYCMYLLLGFLVLIIILVITEGQEVLLIVTVVIIIEILVGYFIYRTSSQKRTERTLIVISVLSGSLSIFIYLNVLGYDILSIGKPFVQENYIIFLVVLELALLLGFCVWGYQVQKKQIPPPPPEPIILPF